MSDPIPFFKALADETRLRLLHILDRHELNVNELMTIMDMGQSRISRHLKILSSADLLVSRRDGLWVFYSAAATGEARSFLDAALPFVAKEAIFISDLNMAAGVLEERARSTRHFFNAIAEDWDELSRDILGAFDLPKTIAELIPEGAVAVDLGCGTGHVLEAMLGKAARVIGVDGSARMLELARRRLLADAERISLRIGDLEHLPLRDAEAGFISINMVLHHLFSPDAALLEARRVLRPGGTLVLSDFDTHSFEAMRQNYGDRWLGFSASALTSALEKAGFVLCSISQVPVLKGLFIHLVRAEAPKNTGDSL